jgi:hypothetical protein
MMLLTRLDLLETVRVASGPELLPLVQGAVELEFATIPPYLTAMLSLKPGSNREIWEILHSVVVEEMLHMAINCNLMTALGGGAAIDRPAFLPCYPTALPMAINTTLRVPLEAYSPDVVRNVFMEIEAPETPIDFPVAAEESFAEPFATIGQFYAALAQRLGELGRDVFVGDPAHQLDAPGWFGTRLRTLRTPADAIAAISALVEEGEGTSKSPLDPEGQIAHYYRFEQLIHGRYLIADATVPEGYSYSGARIPFDPAAVHPLTPNQRLAALQPDTQAYRLASQFAFTFTKMLKALHQTFNGTPAAFDNAMGLMFELRLVGQRLCAHPAGDGRHTVGPVFEYVTRSG